MRKPLVACLALFVVALAAGCGGGGSSGGVVPSGGGQAGSAGSTGASVTIVIPPKPATSLEKSPAYVSPNTASIGVVVTPQGGTAYAAVIANVPGSQCTAVSGGYTCTISVTATFGVDTVAITAYSAANAGGSILSSGSITSTFSAIASPSPALDVVLTGAVKQIGLTIVHGSVMDPYVPIGDAATLNVVAKDASGAVIVGTYDTPIVVALPGGSGLSLGTASFADSNHTTSALTYLGAPSYYNAPTSAVTISASAGAVTQTLAFHPVTALLSFAAGDGGANANDIRNMVPSGGNLIYLTSDDVAGGELVSMNPSTGVQTILNAALAYVPNAVLVDPKFGGTWISTSQSGTAALHCVSGANDTPISVATAGPSDPWDMTVDGTDHLWFTDDDYAGNVTLNGLCSVDPGGPQFQELYDDRTTVYSSGIAADTSIGNVWIGNSQSLGSDVFRATVAASPVPEPVDLPIGSEVGEMTRDAAGNILVTVYDPSGTSGGSRLRPAFGVGASDSFIEMIPAGQYGFSTGYYTLPAGSSPYAIAAQPSVGGLVAYGSHGVGILSPAQPDQSFIVPPSTVGQNPFCDGLAFDGVGQPWGLCTGDDSSALVRLVLTDSWNVFSNLPSPMPVAASAQLAVAGGTASQTFTVGCTGGITCTFRSGSPRVIDVRSTVAGSASVTVTDNAGRSVVTNLTVNGTRITITKKRPDLRKHRLRG